MLSSLSSHILVPYYSTIIARNDYYDRLPITPRINQIVVLQLRSVSPMTHSVLCLKLDHETSSAGKVGLQPRPPQPTYRIDLAQSYGIIRDGQHQAPASEVRPHRRDKVRHRCTGGRLHYKEVQ
jgi:hypothetical protein